MFQYWYNNSGNLFESYSLDEILSFDLKESTLIFKSDKEDWHSKGKNFEFANYICFENSQKTFEKPYFSKPYNWWRVSFIISLLLILISIERERELSIGISSESFSVMLIISIIFAFKLFFRNWEIIRNRILRIEPSKAVGFYYIRFFNINWFFKAPSDLIINQKTSFNIFLNLNKYEILLLR
ncbi:hypothetical protein KO506_14775 [Polaribacter vadi]|uniref:hypothetical protein n=1 Tax=Polaribacter TaxID=52959 RepID=UPI001C098092|nr:MULTISPECIES: hypothetical protein [Polaribacter]MBU3012675.1 hypothetical protein [Polaribacter vadi]MDO6742492.1 hypothetical protein [Polaribacter sp. 1_MG-2023]